MCWGVIHSIGDSHDIRFIDGLSIYIPFTSSSLMVSNFALCVILFLVGFVKHLCTSAQTGFIRLRIPSSGGLLPINSM